MATILVVDDDEGVREFLEIALQNLGHRAVLTENSAQAQQWLQEHTPDLILMDLMMPGLNGLELGLWVHAQPKTRSVPIIQISALDDTPTQQDSLQGGAFDYLTKPIQPEILKSKLERALAWKNG
ncbi:MAG: response regulator [Elusimicrobia bacterium]|nr:response regulator [Elusimicrobiota bacterium]